MKVSQEAVQDRQATLNIELEPQDLEGYLDRAYRRVVQRTVVPGFRKGKAPRQVVERYVGREALLNEALDFLVPEATSKAIEQESLETAGQPQVELLEMEPVTIKATVPLTPVVELADYRDIRLAVEAQVVGEEQIDGALEQLRQDLAPWEPVDRLVQYDDLVTLDLKAEVEGRTVVDSREQSYIPRQDDPFPVPGFAEELLGLAKEATKVYILPFPEDYGDATLRGKECSFTATVLEVKEKRFAKLDDEFAKGVEEGYDSLEALKEKISNSLQTEADRAAERNLEEQVVEAVVQGTRFEIPPMLVEHEIDHLQSDQEEALRRRQVTMEEYLHNVGKTQEQLREELRDTALQRLQRSLALSRVAEAEGIETTEEELQGEIESMVSTSEEQGELLRRYFSTDSARGSLNRSLWMRKTLQRLTSIARGEVPAAAEGEMEPASTEAASSAEQETTQLVEGGKQDAV